MANGTITTVTARGFGFIRPTKGGDDVFFHRSVLEGSAFEQLRRGDPVTYNLGTDRHRPDRRAVMVRRDTDTDAAHGRS